MEIAIKKLFLLVLALASLPVSAELDKTDTDTPEMARVVTQNGLLSDCLAPVAINRIDGEIRVLPARGFDIEPGVHTVNGRATLDTAKCHPIDGDLQIGSAPGLEVNFETGRIYYIAYDHSSDNPGEWQLVVWKVEVPEPLPDFIRSSDSIQ